MSKLESVVFATESGGVQELKVSSLNEEEILEFWGSPTEESIDGTLRSNVRGYRQEWELIYQTNFDQDIIKSIIDNILQDIDDGRGFFYFGIDIDNVLRVHLDSDFEQSLRARNRVGRYIPKIRLRAHTIRGVIVTFLDYRFINEAVDTYLDYGLVSEEVEEEKDYGFLT